MTKTSVCMLSVSVLLLVAGCNGSKEPVANVPKAPTAEGNAAGGAGPLPVPECSPAADDQYSTSPGPRMRVTFNADGSVNQIEGKDLENNWEPALHSQTNEPASVGNCVARLEIYMHDGSETDLKDDAGDSTHSHAIQTNPPYNTHCHKWAYSGGTRYLAHC